MGNVKGFLKKHLQNPHWTVHFDVGYFRESVHFLAGPDFKLAQIPFFFLLKIRFLRPREDSDWTEATWQDSRGVGMRLKPVSLACVSDFHDFVIVVFAIFHFALNFTIGTALPHCVLLKLWV